MNAVVLYNFAGAAADDLPSRATSRAPSLRHSLLRTDRIASSRAKNQRAATLRRNRALSSRDYPMGAAARVHVGRDSGAVLRLSECHARFRAMASAVSKKARRTRRFDGGDHDRPALARENDAGLPMRDSGSMRQGDFLEHSSERIGQARAGKSSAPPVSLRRDARTCFDCRVRRRTKPDPFTAPAVTGPTPKP